MEAVATGLRSYRDGNNPEGTTIRDSELAARLGVSKSTLSKYLQAKQLIGGEPLQRMLTELGIAINYKTKEISAREFGPRRAPSDPEQISFVFEAPCGLHETTENVTVSIPRKDANRSTMTVQIRIAG
jgi:transcriptional regulator with XRE-family HTH domain